MKTKKVIVVVSKRLYCLKSFKVKLLDVLVGKAASLPSQIFFDILQLILIIHHYIDIIY